MAVLGLRFCARAFSSCGKWGPLFITARGPLTIAASPAAEHRLQTCRLSNCGSRAQPPRGTWDPPRPGLEPASPASAGRLSTTAPPGKPFCPFFNRIVCSRVVWVLYTFWILTPYQIYDLQIFLSFSSLPFHFVDGFLCCSKAFYLELLQVFIFVFAFSVTQKIITKIYVKELTA